MTDINITKHYFRAEDVLLSCTTPPQVKNSLNYIKLYYKLSGDYCGYEILLRKYHKLTLELKTHE
jgi:hypothetical protein|tara:strand:+ start:2300 stop:2494 length:195 start_codon:yes stop_codon:yes gene_type:complete